MSNYWTEIADAAVLTVIAEHRGAGEWHLVHGGLRTKDTDCWCPLELAALPDHKSMEKRHPMLWANRIMDTADVWTIGGHFDFALRASMLEAAGLTEEP